MGMKHRHLLPTIPVTEVAEIVQAAPTLYLQPMSKTAIHTLQTLGEDQLINQACVLEHQAGVSQVSLMRKYSIGRDRLYKALHGEKISPGGTQYVALKKEDNKEEPAKASVQPEVKLEKFPDVLLTKGKGRGGGKSSRKK